jgi:hypothetical protein
MPSALDLCPLLLAINSQLQFTRGEGGKKKRKEKSLWPVTIRQRKRKERERRDLDYYLRFFLVFIRECKILI